MPRKPALRSCLTERPAGTVSPLSPFGVTYDVKVLRKDTPEGRSARVRATCAAMGGAGARTEASMVAASVRAERSVMEATLQIMRTGAKMIYAAQDTVPDLELGRGRLLHARRTDKGGAAFDGGGQPLAHAGIRLARRGS